MRTLISFDKLDRLVGEVLPERALMSTVVPPIAGGAGGLDSPFGGDASGSDASDAASPAMGDNAAGHQAMDPAATGADHNAADPSAAGDDTAPDVVDDNAAPLPVAVGDNDSPMPGAVDDSTPTAADPAAADPAATDPAAVDPAAADPAAADPAAADDVTVTDPVTANDNAAPLGGGSDGTTVVSACQSTQTVATGGLVGALGLSSNAQNTNLACEPAAVSHG